MFQGSFVALVTPFTENHEIDWEAYGRLIDFHLANGTHGLVPCGCTGEAATLSHAEQKECFRFVMDKVGGTLPVVAGAGSNNTREAIDLAKGAEEAGCDAILSITPYYNKPTAEGQIAHYRAIAEAISIPVMLYNVPSRTGTRMEPDTIAEMSKVPGIASIKEACGSVDQVTQIRARCGINIVSGDDSLTLPMIAVGAEGVVSVAANIVPDQVAALCNAALAGNYAQAREIHYRIAPLFSGLFFETNPIPVKAALARMGLIKNVVRLPLTPMRPEPWARLEAILKELGLI